MTDGQSETWLAGVDGCPGGWIVAFARADGEIEPPRVVTRFADIAFSSKRPAIIAIDVPIGLPRQSPAKGRQAESVVRPLLGARKSSVFRIPSRSAVYASVAAAPADARERFFHACRIARETSDDGKAFAKQGFYILDKVVEVDTLLRGDAALARRVFETHPELAFRRMNGDRPLDQPKKVKTLDFPHISIDHYNYHISSQKHDRHARHLKKPHRVYCCISPRNNLRLANLKNPEHPLGSRRCHYIS